MGNVIQFRGITKLDLEPDIVLENTKGQLSMFFIVGYDKDGEFYFSSTMGNGGDILWLMEKAKLKLMDIGSD